MSDDTVTYTAELKLPTLEANLTKYGEIRELKHPWFKRTFEAGKDGNQVEMIRFQNILEGKGYKTERKDHDKLLIVKGSISVLLVFHYPPFSDSTVEQLGYIFDTLDQEVRDSMQSQLQKAPTLGTVHKGSPYRDGDWFESCKPDDHD
ncbi:MAG: hypothetical protein ACTH7L_01825 [Psychrobacter alimentarius]